MDPAVRHSEHMLKPLVVVVDDDVRRLAPFFVRLIEARGHDVEVFERWGKAAQWITDVASPPLVDRKRIAAIVLDVMFALQLDDQKEFARIVGRRPSLADAKLAGKYLLPLFGQHMPEIPVLIHSNLQFDDRQGRDILGEEADFVCRAFRKPAQSDFFEELNKAVEQWKRRRGEARNRGDKDAQ